jgi:hypothetical protein
MFGRNPNTHVNMIGHQVPSSCNFREAGCTHLHFQKVLPHRVIGEENEEPRGLHLGASIVARQVCLVVLGGGKDPVLQPHLEFTDLISH